MISIQRVISIESGFLEYRTGTGDNTEITNIQVDDDKHRQGTGRRLVYDLLDVLASSDEAMYIPPHSIFGFTMQTNHVAQAFCRAMGFRLTWVGGLYCDGDAVLFCQSYEALKERRKEHEKK